MVCSLFSLHCLIFLSDLLESDRLAHRLLGKTVYLSLYSPCSLIDSVLGFIGKRVASSDVWPSISVECACMDSISGMKASEQ